MISWPPTHKIRRSKRARNISLSLTPHRGLEIVLPIRATVEEGMSFLNDKRQWVEKHLPKIDISSENEMFFPQEVSLTALNQSWPIRYHHIHRSKKVNLRCINERLVFTGPIHTFDDCKSTFNQWLRKLAHQHLPQHLLQISQETQLSFNRLSIRSQKTLWGSCTYQKDISLNDRLLFLPYELMRYVMIHELCHTVYLGHGKRFWKLVSTFDSNYKFNERNLRDVSTYLPAHFHS